MPRLLYLLYHVFLGQGFIIYLRSFSGSSFGDGVTSYIFLLFTDTIVFAASCSGSCTLGFFPFGEGGCFIVGVYSGVLSSSGMGPCESEGVSLLCFNRVEPLGNVSSFLSVVQLFELSRSSLEILLVNRIPSSCGGCCSSIQSVYSGLSVSLVLGGPSSSITSLLGGAGFTLLPFPSKVSSEENSFLTYVSGKIGIVAGENGCSATSVSGMMCCCSEASSSTGSMGSVVSFSLSSCTGGRGRKLHCVDSSVPGS